MAKKPEAQTQIVTTEGNKPNTSEYQDFLSYIIDEKFRDQAYLFVDHYLEHFDIYAAVRFAERTTGRVGHLAAKYKEDICIQKELSLRIKDMYGSAIAQRSRVLRELERISFANIEDFITTNSEGVITLRDDVPREYLAAVKKMKQVVQTRMNHKTGVEETTTTVEVLLADKTPALKLLATHLAMIKGDKEPDKGDRLSADEQAFNEMSTSQQIEAFEASLAELKNVQENKARTAKVIVSRKQAFSDVKSEKMD
jgi:hypothetical protein